MRFSCFELGDGLTFDGTTLSVSSVATDKSASSGMSDINLIHFYNVYSDNGDVSGMQVSVDASDIIALVNKNKLVVGLNNSGVVKSPFFVYNVDDTAVYWYQLAFDSALAYTTYKQVGTDLTKI